MAIVKEEIIKKYQIHDTDRGSAPVQVAILTARINDLRTHFDSNKKDHPHDDGVIPLHDGIESEPTHAGPPKHNLNNNGSAQQPAQLKPEIGDNRDHGVPEGMLQDDSILRESPGPGGHNVVFTQDLEHA